MRCKGPSPFHKRFSLSNWAIAGDLLAIALALLAMAWTGRVAGECRMTEKAWKTASTYNKI
eukprot:15389415-Heterocapsa_arctica.AAC.1